MLLPGRRPPRPRRPLPAWSPCSTWAPAPSGWPSPKSGPAEPSRIVEEPSRGVLLGRDTFSSGGAIRSSTGRRGHRGPRRLPASHGRYGVSQVRAVATSAVREARNGDVFLDRIRRRTGIEFDIINEAEEGRLLFLAVRDIARGARGVQRRMDAAGGGRRRQHQPDAAAARRADPLRGLRARRRSASVSSSICSVTATTCRSTLLRRYIANIIEEIRVEMPLNRVSHLIAHRRRCAVRCGADPRRRTSEEPAARDRPRARSWRSATRSSGSTRTSWSSGSACPPSRRRRSLPALLVYRTLLAETAARRIVVSRRVAARRHAARHRPIPASRSAPRSSSRQVLASAEALGQRYRFDREHGRHVAMLAMRLFDVLRDEHGLGERHRLLLQVAALLHDVGIYVSLRAHHKHSQYMLAASQIFGLSDEETAIVANIARYHRGALPQRDALAVRRARSRGSHDRQQARGDPAHRQRARRRAPPEGPRPAARAA